MAKLTKRTVDVSDPRAVDYFVWDEKLAGFGLRVRASGRKTFLVQYRTPEGRQRRRVLGPTPPMTADQARVDAEDWLRSARRGKDPAEARDRNRAARSMRELCDAYLEDYAEVHKKPKSAAEDRRIIERYILPALGKKRPASISQEDIGRVIRKMAETPYMANRTRAVLSKIFNDAENEMRGLRPDWRNPCLGVRRFQEKKRRRYLSGAELAELGKTLAVAEKDGLPPVENHGDARNVKREVAAIRLLIFTGCRRSEILTLKWDQVDVEARRLRLEDSKTGAKDVFLPAPAMQVLEGLKRKKGNPYVIPGRRIGSHLKDLKHVWPEIRKAAGLEDLRLHDLRHSFASVAAGAGLSLPVIGALLGHSEPSTTARYAHLAADPLQEAADLIGSRLAAAMGGGEGGEIVELPKNRSRKKAG